MLQLTIWSVPAIAALALTGHTLASTRSRRDTPGVAALYWLGWCVVFWAAGQLLGTLTTDLDLKILGAKLQYPGVAFLPLAWFAFAMAYARRQRQLSRGTVMALGAIPAATLLLALTNEWHRLIWTEQHLIAGDGYVGLGATYGPWFKLHVTYGYALIATGTIILAWEFSRSGAYRRPLAAVLGAPIVVGALNLFYLSPFNPIPWFDPTVLGFAFAALVLRDGVIRVGLLDSAPTMRSRVVELLLDGVVIVDRDGRIIDINPAGASILGVKLDETLSRSIDELLDRSPHVPGLLRGESARIPLRSAWFDVKSTVLSSNDSGPIEIALVLRDVTDQQRNEQDLAAAKAKFEIQAHVDDLTQLANRRMFVSRLQEEIGRVHRGGQPLSLLLFDLDHFKTINDNHGHDVGDRALSLIGRLTLEFKRTSDVAARLGGEEFALLLPDTDQVGAVRVAQRLRATIEDTRFTDNRGMPIRITASFGVATISRNGSVDHVLTHADRALYKAKNSGRNRVCTPD
jgi:diguanylate cyclase (GGDEF)-like protein/PAS domain S-box-containing protein